MSLEENKAVVRRFVEEVQCRHNLAAMDELYSPDFVDRSGMTDPPNLESVHRFFGGMFAGYALYRWSYSAAFAAASSSRIQIGERYLLPAYPFLILLAARLAPAMLGRRGGGLALLRLGALKSDNNWRAISIYSG